MTKSKIIGFWIVLASAGLAHAQGDPGAGKAKAEVCAGCHGEDGNASVPIFPKLAGQHASYLAKQLREYKAGKRVDQTMNAMAESLSDADIADLSAYFAKQKIKVEKAEPNALGEKIFRAGDAAKAVPACAACHGPSGGGNPQAGVPSLRGQYAAYLSKTLNDYKSGERNNDPNEMLRTISSRLSEKEIDAVADYISGLQ